MTSLATINDISFFHSAQPESVTEMLITGLLRVCGSSKKMISTAALNSLRILVKYTPTNSKYSGIIYNLLGEKNCVVRQAAAECLKIVLEKNMDSAKHNYGSSEGELLEKCILKSLGDADERVRKLGRESIFYYEKSHAERALAYLKDNCRLIDLLDSGIRKTVLKRVVPVKTPINLPTVSSNSLAETIHPVDNSKTPTKHISEISLKSKMLRSPLISQNSPKVREIINDAIAVSKTPVKVEGKDTICSKLSSTSKSLQERGYYELLSILQEHTLLHSNETLSFESEDLYDVAQQLLKLYEISTDDFLATLVDFSYIQMILESGLLKVSDLYMPFVQIRSTKNQNPLIVGFIDQFMDYIRSFPANDLLNLRISFDSFGKTAKNSPAFREQLRKSQDFTINFIYDILKSKQSALRWFDDSGVRCTLNCLVPIYNSTSTTLELKQTICHVLEKANQSGSSMFLKTLETFDYEACNSIKNTLGINSNSDILDISLIQSADEENGYDDSVADFLNVYLTFLL